MADDCIFCKIANGEIPTKTVYEDELIRSFYDAAPQAPVHVLIVPKKHVGSLDEATGEDHALLGHMLLKAAEIAKSLGLENGYRVVINTGEDGGQRLFRLSLTYGGTL